MESRRGSSVNATNVGRHPMQPMHFSANTHIRGTTRPIAASNAMEESPCRIRSDRQTTSLTLTTGVCEAGTKMRGATNMNIHYDVTGLLTAAWRSHSGRIVWAA